MRALIQRAAGASVAAGGRVLGEIGPASSSWSAPWRATATRKAARLARKTVTCASSGTGAAMNRSLLDTGGAALVVSQFTLAADQGQPARLSTAAEPDGGGGSTSIRQVAGHGVGVATGAFGADMRVALVNDGPVTIWLDTAAR